MSLVILEGNICAGKSFLRDLALSLQLVPNPNAFREVVVPRMLRRFYADPPTHALRLQEFMFQTCVWNARQAHEAVVSRNENALIDRGVGGNMMFEILNRVAGNISEEDHLEYLDVAISTICHPTQPTTTVFLIVSPEECLRRNLEVRQNAEEAGIPLSYFESLDKAHFVLMMWRALAGNVKALLWENPSCEDSVALLKHLFRGQEWKNDLLVSVTFTRNRDDVNAFLIDWPDLAKAARIIEQLRTISGETNHLAVDIEILTSLYKSCPDPKPVLTAIFQNCPLCLTCIDLGSTDKK
jgi:deoxyadenosine/deoxycytidine kinase